MSIFYCPNCKKTDENFDGKGYKTLWANCRDGWGRGIYHISCPNCGYVLSGYMHFSDKDDLEYVQATISMYSDKTFLDVEKLIEELTNKMNKIIWKVKVITAQESLFEQFCKENNICYKPYPKPIVNTYRVECEKDRLLDIGYCIATLEEMPEVRL